MSIKEKERKPAPKRKVSRNSATPRQRENVSASDVGNKRTHSGAPRRTQDKKPQESTKVSSDVVYLPPKPFNRNRLILRLATVVAVVLAITVGVSVFFKVDTEKTMVSGNEIYSAWDVLQASGIKDGTNLLTFSRAQASGKIITALPYVDQVRIGIKLPDTVNIEIVEIKVPYAIKAQDESWWLIGASGKVIEKAEDGAQSGYTKILGVQLDTPIPGREAVAWENAQTQTDPEGNTVPVTMTQARRLETALDIAEFMELNGIFGKATSVDVNNLSDIQIMYGQQYQVKLGTDTQLSYKISCLKYVVEKMDSYQSGVLDISFITWPNKVGYTPFDGESGSILEIL